MIARVNRSGKMPRAPRHSQLTHWFWQALSDGEFTSTKCNNCGRVSFPPRPDCPQCWAGDMIWTPLAATGRLYSRSRIAVVPEVFIDHAPLDIGVVDLDDGIRLLCWLIGGAESLLLDAPVEMVALCYEDGALFAARAAGTT